MTNMAEETELATFAGGCFWCMVKPFDELPGIVSIVSGYTGGQTIHPTYEDVCSETTGHAEAVQIAFRPAIFPYERLLDIFWRQIDPTDKGGQFQDRGGSFRTAIYYHNERQRLAAERSKRELKKSRRFKGPIVTEIAPAVTFYPAEEEHQNYYKNHFVHYRMYRQASGRDAFIHRYWNTAKDRESLRVRLAEQQWQVTQNGVMEPAFENAFWSHEEKGWYVDIVTGDPLFGSTDKYDAGDGWPAFAKPLRDGLVELVAELSGDGGPARTAVRGRLSGAFLGYLFKDGPGPGREHYRINSAALRFIPAAKLELEW